MYYKEIRVWVPDEEVLNIKFLKHDKFFVLNYLNKPYIITAEVSGTKNFIGFGADGNIFLLDRERNRVAYASSSLAVFGRQLKHYRDFVTVPENIDEENEMTKNAENTENAEVDDPTDKLKKLEEQIKKLDKNAFTDENNFWSEVINELKANEN